MYVRRVFRQPLTWLFVAVATVVLLPVIGGPFVRSHGLFQSSPGRAAFLSDAHRSATGWSASNQRGRPHRDQLWIDAHPAETLAEGRRACAWLAGRPDVPRIDPSGDSDPDSLAMDYAKAHKNVPLAVTTRWGVTGSAWRDLCADTRVDKTSPRQPHHDD